MGKINGQESRRISGNIGEHWGTLGNIREHRGTLGNIGEHWGTSGNIGEHRGTSGNIGEHWGTDGGAFIILRNIGNFVIEKFHCRLSLKAKLINMWIYQSFNLRSVQ